MENIEDKYSHIKGWGIDADPENDPTYPMKQLTGADHQRLNYERAPQQPENIEILHSNERPAITRVFGTSTPPKGLSGMIRRYAFTYSESSYGRWVPLVLADRISVVEGYIDDLKQGIIPNPFSGRGWQAEWKYNKKGLATKVAAGAVAAAAVVVLLSLRNNKVRKGVF